MAGDLLAGVRIIVARPALARATLASTVSCVAQGMLTACVPLLGERVLGGAGRGAALLSCAAVSALLATAVLARFPRALAPGTIIWAGALVQAAALASAATGSPLVLVVAFLATGCAEGPQLAALFTVRHREAPERLRGQVFTTGASVKITGFAVGAATAGPSRPAPCPPPCCSRRPWRPLRPPPTSRSVPTGDRTFAPNHTRPAAPAADRPAAPTATEPTALTTAGRPPDHRWTSAPTAAGRPPRQPRRDRAARPRPAGPSPEPCFAT